MSDDRQTSSVLAQRIREGDRAAFEEFFRGRYPSVVGYAARLGVDRAVAEDLAQEAFVRVWTNRAQINPTRSIDAFVFVSARNLTLNSMRDKKNRQRLLESNLTSVLSTDDPGGSIDASSLKHQIDGWIGGLPDREREAFTLSRFSNLSHKEIADLMGISRQTVGKHITNALRTLRDKLAATHPELTKT